MAGASTVAGTDVEAIQNQIDLSLSLAFDLVASWSIPKNEDASESILSSAPDADDLMQWYFASAWSKHPHPTSPKILLNPYGRLGVGAPIPAASGTNYRSVKETNMLKRKLVPSLKKNTEDNTLPRHHSKKVDDEDNDDSRTASLSASKKRTRQFDAFEPKDKRKKQHGYNGQFVTSSIVSTTGTETTKNDVPRESLDSPVIENRQDSSSTLTSGISTAPSESSQSSSTPDNTPEAIDPSGTSWLLESPAHLMPNKPECVSGGDVSQLAEPVTVNRAQKISTSKRRRQRRKEKRLKGVGGIFIQHST